MRNILKGYHEIIAISVTLSAGTGGTAVFTPAALGPVYSLSSLPIGTQIQLVQIEGVDTYVFLHNGSEIGSLTITADSGYNFELVEVNGIIVTSTAITLNDGDAIEVFFVIDRIIIKLNYNPSTAPHLHWEDGGGSSINVLNVGGSYYFLGWDGEELQLGIPNTSDKISVFCKFNRGYGLDGLSYTLGGNTTQITTSTQPFQLSDGGEFNATEQELPIELRTYVVDDNDNDMLGIGGDWIGGGLEPQTDYYSTTLPLTSEYFQVTSGYSASSGELTLTIDGDRLLRLAVNTSDGYNLKSLEYGAFVDGTGFDRFQTIATTDDGTRYNTYQTYTMMGRYPLALKLVVNQPRFILYEEPTGYDSAILNNASQVALSLSGASNVMAAGPSSFKYIISDDGVSGYQYGLISVVLDNDWSNPMAYAFEIRDGGTMVYAGIRQSNLDGWVYSGYFGGIFNSGDATSISELGISGVTDLESLGLYLFNLFHP